MEENTSKILVVDDNKDIHEDIRHILTPVKVNTKRRETQALKQELFGDGKLETKNTPAVFDINYRIDSAYQGEEAVLKVKQACREGSPYCLAFMDVRMPPGMDGVETIEKLWEVDPYIEIVISTAYSDYSWDQILFKFGHTDHLLFIKKPFDSVSIKQITLALTTKWILAKLNRGHIDNLESEVKKRTVDLKGLVEKLRTEIALRQEKEGELAHLAHVDHLTGLLNRNSFYLSIARLISHDESRKMVFFLFFIDIDGFKQVNDLFGHDMGDLLLKEIAERVKSVLGHASFKLPPVIETEKDPRPWNAIFRLGGDEFVALIAVKDKKQVINLATELVKRVKVKYVIDKTTIRISCSLGISAYPDDSMDTGILLKYADLAMYRAKEAKGIYQFFDKEKDSSLIRTLELENELKSALAEKQIIVEYQGLLDRTDQIIGIDTLIRWQHPALGVLKPHDFIPIAERSNLIIDIGKYVLNTACAHLKQLHEKGFGNVFVLVNCTLRQFYDPYFIEIIKQILEETKLDPRHLKLGLEEKFSIQDPEKSLSVITLLNKMGVHFTIDGLGRGKSLFNFLQTLPKETTIKIDRAFVKNIVSNSNDKNFLFILLDLIKSRDLNVIISGIETKEQKDILNLKDCILQGFYFNKPKQFKEFVKDIAKFYKPS